MTQTKYINSIFGNLEEYQCLDIRPKESSKAFPIPFIFNLIFYSEKDLKKLKNLGFSSPIGKELMERIENLTPYFSTKKTVLLFDEKPFYIAQAIWQHFQPSTEVFIYKGGFKALLKETERVFKYKYQFATLYGETGVGKTKLLEFLENKGEQVLNLEKIANHQGSIFGNLSNNNQPSQETFILVLAQILSQFDRNRPVFVESEKLNLGKNVIPLSLAESLENGIKVRLTLSKDDRIKRLVQEYAGVNDFKLKDGIEKLKFRIGKTDSTQMLDDLKQKNYQKVAERLIDYFDVTESYQSIHSLSFDLTLSNQDLTYTTNELIRILGKKKRLP